MKYKDVVKEMRKYDHRKELVLECSLPLKVIKKLQSKGYGVWEYRMPETNTEYDSYGGSQTHNYEVSRTLIRWDEII